MTEVGTKQRDRKKVEVENKKRDKDIRKISQHGKRNGGTTG